MVFGRKGVTSPGAPASNDPRMNQPGHSHVLGHLDRNEEDEPLQRARLAGRIVFELTCKMLSGERGVRIEDALAALASNGGFACIVATLTALRAAQRTPQSVGVIEVGAKDGQRYYFGDMPNTALWEHPESLLSLALGAAQGCGGSINREMVEVVMSRTASALGSEQFGRVLVEAPHRPGDEPIEYVRHLWPNYLDALALYKVPADQWPMTFGFALQLAIEGGKEVLDPTLAARICIDCAVPMAKLDPQRFPEHSA